MTETNYINGRNFVDEDLVRTQYPKALNLARKGFFVRIADEDFVVCPMGHILRHKSDQRNGFTRYCNKLACKTCPEKCCTQVFKEVDMSPKKNVMPTPEKRKQLRERGLMIPLYFNESRSK